MKPPPKTWSLKRLGVALLMAGLILSHGGCSLATYKPYDRKRTGYFEARVSGNRWLVTFSGNEFYSVRAARDFAWLRAAEITRREGARYFVILAEVDSSGTKVRRSSTSFSSSSGISGGTPRGPANVPNQRSPEHFAALDSSRSSSSTMVLPRIVLRIDLLQQIPAGAAAGQYHEAEPLIAKLRAQYGLR